MICGGGGTLSCEVLELVVLEKELFGRLYEESDRLQTGLAAIN